MNPKDRRVKRTQRLLTDALIALAQEQTLETISIRDITARADVSYSTFFRHYTSIEQLLIEILENTVNEMRDLVTQPPEQSGPLIFQHVQGHPALYRVLLMARRNARINQHIQAIITGELLKVQRPSRRQQPPSQVVAHHIMVSTLGLIEWWLENQMPYPPERMGIWYSELVIKPVQSLTESSLPER